MSSEISASITDTQVSVLVDGRFRSFPRTTDQGARLIEALKRQPQDREEICEIADIQTWIAKRSFGRVVVDDMELLRLDGKEVDFGLQGKLQRMVEEGIDVTPLTRFIERVAQNPDVSVAEDLYTFLEKGDLPITPAGFFHCWKTVDPDFRSGRAGNEPCTIDFGGDNFHVVTGKIPHPVGATVSMPRELCDPNRNSACSVGLHACSFSYLPSYSGGTGHTLLLLIDPADVTAIPNEHGLSKLRCCRLKVVGEVEDREAAKTHFVSVVEPRYEAPVKDAGHWVSVAKTVGAEEGEEDRLNGSGYDPAPSIFPDMEAAFRLPFAQAYLTAYDKAYNHAPSGWEAFIAGTQDGPKEEWDDSDPTKITATDSPRYGMYDQLKLGDWYVAGYLWACVQTWKWPEYYSEKAADAGAADGLANARRLSPTEVPDPEATHGDRWLSIPEDQEAVYAAAYINAYISKWRATAELAQSVAASQMDPDQ